MAALVYSELACGESSMSRPKEVNLTSFQAAALKVVQGVYPNAPMILIGAAALGSHIELARQTEDIDLAVSLPAESCGVELAQLPNWERDEKTEHRFYSPTGQMVDLLPAAPELRAKGAITWSSGVSMSLVGFDLAFDNATPYEVITDGKKTGLTVAVPSGPTIALLKMRAWLDRPAERTKDLQDLAQLFAEYVDADDMRRFDQKLVDLALNFEEASPYLLGNDLGQLMRDYDRAHVELFLEKSDPEQLEYAGRTFDPPEPCAHAAFTRGFRSTIQADRVDSSTGPV